MYWLFKLYTKLKFKINLLLLKYENRYHIERIRSSGGIIGNDCKFGRNVKISGYSKIRLGDNVHIGSGCYLKCEGGVTIGDNVILSRNITIYSRSHNYKGNFLPFDNSWIIKPVEIQDNSWIGMNVNIPPGTTIGEGSIIGLGTSLFGKIEPLSIIGSRGYNLISKRTEEHYNRLKKEKKFCKENGEQY